MSNTAQLIYSNIFKYLYILNVHIIFIKSEYQTEKRVTNNYKIIEIRKKILICFCIIPSFIILITEYVNIKTMANNITRNRKF